MIIFWDIWPPSYPDLNPLDFYVRGKAEQDTYRAAYNAKADLVKAITFFEAVFVQLLREEVANSCSRVRGRYEEIIANDGDFIC